MGRESHGHDPAVLHSSVALLQERFRQLQRVKEMREERELLRILTSESKQFICNSKSSMTTTTTTNCELPPPPVTTVSFSYPELMMSRAPTSPPSHSHVSLSLWPPSSSSSLSSSSQEPPREIFSSVVTFLEPPETPRLSMVLWRKNAFDCDGSDSDSGVDTSLHL